MFGKTRKLSMRFHCQKEKSLEKERYNCGGIESFENDCQTKKTAKLRWKHEYSWSQWQRAEGRGGVSVNNLRRVAGELGKVKNGNGVWRNGKMGNQKRRGEEVLF